MVFSQTVWTIKQITSRTIKQIFDSAYSLRIEIEICFLSFRETSRRVKSGFEQMNENQTADYVGSTMLKITNIAEAYRSSSITENWTICSVMVYEY